MSENDAPEPKSPASSEEAKENALLFGVWDVSEMGYTGPSMSRCIKATSTAHTVSRHVSKQFQKSEISIAERPINHLMQTENDAGHKQRASKIAGDTLEIVNERTGGNPVQVLIRAVEDVGPREETVRFKYGGISVPQVIGVAPQRRVDEALKFITQGTLDGSYRTTTAAAEAFTRQLIGTAGYDVQAYATSQKEEKERVTKIAR